MVAHFPGLGQAFQWNMVVLTKFYEHKPALLVKWCGIKTSIIQCIIVSFIVTAIDWIPWPTPRNCNEVRNWSNFFCRKVSLTLRQKKLLQISHCEVSIYMQQHSNSTCIWSICLSVDSIFQSLWFLSWFFRDREWLLTRKLLFHGRHHDLANSYVLSVSCCFTVATMTWLTVRYYLCHKWSRICYIGVITIRSFPHSLHSLREYTNGWNPKL